MISNWNDCWDMQIFSRQLPLFTFCCHILIWSHSSKSSLCALFSSSWFISCPILSSSDICWQSFNLPYLWMLDHPFQTFAQLRIVNFIQSVCFLKFVVTLYLNDLWLILLRIGIDTKTRLSQDSESWRYFSVLGVENDKSFAVNFKKIAPDLFTSHQSFPAQKHLKRSKILRSVNSMVSWDHLKIIVILIV
jgi:hypothetical protein